MNPEENLYDEIKKFGYQIGATYYKDKEELDKQNFSSRYWQHPGENHKLKGTPFFHSNENDFIHFTSLDSLYYIINTGFIRLYNFHNMDDKLEMEYALAELSFKQSSEKAKEELYCFSMCSSEKILLDETKEHLLWKLHGRDGRGAIIRVCIENNLDKWYLYHLSKVSYGIERFLAIKKFNTDIDIEMLDNKICCFIKHPIYEFENEIRLVFDNTNPVTVTDIDKGKIYPITYPDKLHKKENTFYFQIPLINFNNSNEAYLAPNMQGEAFEIPKIKITEIILGYRYSEEDRINIQSKIGDKFNDVKIKITDLKRYY